jgi:hypothetical protein
MMPEEHCFCAQLDACADGGMRRSNILILNQDSIVRARGLFSRSHEGIFFRSKTIFLFGLSLAQSSEK